MTSALNEPEQAVSKVKDGPRQSKKLDRRLARILNELPGKVYGFGDVENLACSVA
ncbi:hypothetical protein D3C80_1794160 [compost metagenome]